LSRGGRHPLLPGSSGPHSPTPATVHPLAGHNRRSSLHRRQPPLLPSPVASTASLRRAHLPSVGHVRRRRRRSSPCLYRPTPPWLLLSSSGASAASLRPRPLHPVLSSVAEIAGRDTSSTPPPPPLHSVAGIAGTGWSVAFHSPLMQPLPSVAWIAGRDPPSTPPPPLHSIAVPSPLSRRGDRRSVPVQRMREMRDGEVERYNSILRI
jgi:hypothetical protein